MYALTLRACEDRPLPMDRPGLTTILVVGDSFTFGWGVEEGQRYSEALERTFASYGSVRVVNAGHWMYSFDQQLLVLHELVPQLRPRMVIQGLYPPHVLTLMSHAWERDARGRLRAVRNKEVRVAPNGALRSTNEQLESPPFRSQLMGDVFRIWYNWRLSREGMTGDLGLLDPEVQRFSLAWRMCKATIEETAAYLRTERVDYVAFGIPRDLQVSSDEWTDSYREAVKGRFLDLELPTRRMGEIVKGADGAWVDLLPAFRKGYRPNLYFTHDPHWTPEGHALAAEVLAPFVKARLGPAK